MRVPMKEVPLQVRRIAAQHLESLRGTVIMYGAEAAQLGDHAVPIYRPDIERCSVCCLLGILGR